MNSDEKTPVPPISLNPTAKRVKILFHLISDFTSNDLSYRFGHH